MINRGDKGDGNDSDTDGNNDNNKGNDNNNIDHDNNGSTIATIINIMIMIMNILMIITVTLVIAMTEVMILMIVMIRLKIIIRIIMNVARLQPPSPGLPLKDRSCNAKTLLPIYFSLKWTKEEQKENQKQKTYKKNLLTFLSHFQVLQTCF